MAKTTFVMNLYPTANPKPKKTNPHNKANIVIPKTNLDISLDKGVYSDLAVAAKLAICPITVRSPVISTIPFADPYLHIVEKKAIFFVYKGLSCVYYVDLVNNYV